MTSGRSERPSTRAFYRRRPNDTLRRLVFPRTVDFTPDRDSDPTAPIRPDGRWAHLLCGAPVANWIRLLVRHGRPSASALPRAAVVTLSTLLLSPVRAANRPRYLTIAESEPLDRPPVFVLGHWASGVGELAGLLARSRSCTTPSWWQVFNPVSFDRIPWARSLFYRLIAPDGAHDSEPEGPEMPADDEVALAALTTHSYFHCLYFPRAADRQFRRSVLMEELGEADRALWKDALVAFLRAVERTSDGRRLVLGNPAHTGRIPILLRLFPNARFVTVHRSPYTLYPAALRMRRRMHRHHGLQDASARELERQTRIHYRWLLRKYLNTKTRIPDDRLLEIRYEDLIADSKGLLQWIRAELDLEPAPSERRDAFEARFLPEDVEDPAPSRSDLRTVEREWKFAADELGYDRPR